MSKKEDRLIWIDLEMTGLDPDRDTIIEIATLITNNQLELIAEGPNLAIAHSKDVLAMMDAWNQEHHSKSGLIDRIRNSSTSMMDAEAQTLAFLKSHVAANTSPICGNSICQDRRFLYRHMPQLEAFFHYRNLDVSTLKELLQRWSPKSPTFKKRNQHQALADIQESIAELAFYRDQFFNL